MLSVMPSFKQGNRLRVRTQRHLAPRQPYHPCIMHIGVAKGYLIVRQEQHGGSCTSGAVIAW